MVALLNRGNFRMIQLTKINGEEFILNSNLIETIEETPDTIITLTNGKKLVAKESSRVIIQMVIDYQRKIFIR